jgi:hypothetical protein
VSPSGSGRASTIDARSGRKSRLCAAASVAAPMRSVKAYAPSLLLVGVVALLSWPLRGDLNPGLDADGAWEIGLRQALHDGLHWGPDLQFTYGPLGFLHRPLLVYPWSARLAFGWWALMQLVLVAALLWGLTHALRSRVLAVAFTIPLAVTLGGVPDVALTFIGAAALVAGRPTGRWAPALATGLGALAGISLLDKLNTGVTVVALGVIALAAAPSPRRTLWLPYAAALVVTAVLGWAVTGQSFPAIPGYLKGALGIISGYSQAMMVENPERAWELWAAGLLAAIGLVVAWRAGDTLSARGRAGLVALWAVVAFTSFKAAFVRHDGGHSNIYFATLVGALVAFGWAARRRQTVLLLGALFAVTMWAAGGGATPSRQFAIVDHARQFADQARLLTDGSSTNAAIAAARSRRAAVEQVDPGLTAAIGGGTVHVYPNDAGLVWSAGLRWRPLPVFQAYSAYTADLDRQNADMVRSAAGPDFIMWEHTTAFDGRNTAFESPEAMREMLCRFRTAAGPIGRWALLKRGPDRCGPERALATTRAKQGERVAIPPAPDRSSVVLVRIDGIQVGGLEKLRTMLYRAHRREVAFTGPRVARLIPGTAGDGLLLRVPPAADYPPGFALDQRSDTIAADVQGRSGGDLRFRFTSMTIR